MNRPELIERNIALTAERHRRTWRESLRGLILRSMALIPSPRSMRPEPGKAILIRPDHLGDVLLSMPAIQTLKRHAPNLRLFGLTGPWGAEAMAAYPEIEFVLTLAFPGFSRGKSAGGLMAPYILAWREAAALRKLRAETAIILRPDHWWGALVAYLAGVPRRIGYALPEVAPFLTDKIPFQEQHSVLQAMRLVEPWTGVIDPASIRLSFPIADSDREYVQGLLGAQVSSRKPYMVVHPGASTPLKFWPHERWAYAIDKIAERLDALTVFTGSDREHAQIHQIMKLMRRESISLAGETNVAQLAALYESAQVVLGPDTGPLHVAVAAGAPTVHLFGPADPSLFGPWGDSGRQIVVTSGLGCQPCRILDWSGDDPAKHPCMREITTVQVIEAAIRAVRRS